MDTTPAPSPTPPKRGRPTKGNGLDAATRKVILKAKGKLSAAEVAETVGVSARTVYRVWGETRRARRLSDAERARIRRAKGSGPSSRDVARHFRTSHQTVLREWAKPPE